MSELKPCPFCGGEAIIHHAEFMSEYAKSPKEVPKDSRVIRETRRPGAKYWSIEYRRTAYVPQCGRTDCIGRTRKMYETEAEAIFAWNRRDGESNGGN